MRSLKLTGQDEVINDRELLNVTTQPPMQGNTSAPDPASLFEEHIKGCEQNFMFVLWYLDDSINTVFDITNLMYSCEKVNCSCIRLSRDMMQVAQHCSEGVYYKRETE